MPRRDSRWRPVLAAQNVHKSKSITIHCNAVLPLFVLVDSFMVVSRILLVNPKKLKCKEVRPD
jgi:hypothetical protein